ncbi:MAG: WG repeat-containing protein, partial [Bacteroidota bacterium]
MKAGLYLLGFTLLLALGCSRPPRASGEDYYVIRKGRLYGYIDHLGNVAIGPQFSFALPFREGLAGVNVGGNASGDRIPTDGKWGVINTNGQYVFNPVFISPPNGGQLTSREEIGRTLHHAFQFSEHLAPVYTEKGWRYMDTLAREMGQSFRLQSARRFSEGLAAVMIDGYWGYVQRAGDAVVLAIAPDYLYPVEFHNGFALVKNRQGDEIVIDREGNRRFAQYRIITQFRNGAAVIRSRFRGERESASDTYKYAMIDTAGRRWFTPQFDEIRSFGSDLIPVRVGSTPRGNDDTFFESYVGGKWGFVNVNGRF